MRRTAQEGVGHPKNNHSDQLMGNKQENTNQMSMQITPVQVGY
jgi:hypothetical protein